MSEPTREQIKEAFNKTIERWERIVEDVGHHNKSHCSLCSLFPDHIGSCNKNVCPIGLYTKSSICEHTPYFTFQEDKTPANALAELNFLRKVYIWWMEKEVNKVFEKYGIDDLKEEKKEEWEDVTKECLVAIKENRRGGYLEIYHKGNTLTLQAMKCSLNENGELSVRFWKPRDKYKFSLGRDKQCFHILKKK